MKQSRKKALLETVKVTAPGRNRFDLSFEHKTTADFGNLVPVFAKPGYPGDSLSLGCDMLTRLLAMIAPPMQRMWISVHYFFVPYRVLWDGWEDFITGADPSRLMPTLKFGPSGNPSNAPTLANYLGIPDPNNIPGAVTDVEVNAFRWAAYQFIYNEYYRDQNLVPEVPWELIDGSNDANIELLKLRQRAYEHDYFTACLPFTQKGAPVSIPIGTFEDLAVQWNKPPGDNVTYHVDVNNAGGLVGPGVVKRTDFDPNIASDALYVKTSELTAQAALINDLRNAFRVQEFREKDARGGTRYNEFLKSHFGVTPKDARLQRPEYITGTKTPVTISEVLSTAETPSAPQGNMAGHGLSVQAGKYGNYFVEEHGVLMGMLSILPETNYMQGIEKDMLLKDQFDFYFKEFDHLGEQPVSFDEIYAYSGNKSPFGYLPINTYLKMSNNITTGQFQATLDFWHLTRKFGSIPALNANFIECNAADNNRIFATGGTDHFLIDIYHRYMNSRLMSVYSTPSF